jgi:hypothetical protein
LIPIRPSLGIRLFDPERETATAATAYGRWPSQHKRKKKFYANGFTLGMTNADAFIVLQFAGQPIALVNFSYTLAKTLSEKLVRLVADWEAKTGQKLATTETIEGAFFKPAPEVQKAEE